MGHETRAEWEARQEREHQFLARAHSGVGPNPDTAHAYEVTRYGECRSCARLARARKDSV